MTKSQTKKDGKISAQSSQIKDLHTKLDQAVAENSQIREFLSPTSLQKAFTSALQAAQTVSKSTRTNGQGKQPFLGKTPGIPALSWYRWHHGPRKEL